MAACAAGPVPLQFDFNVVITNLNKMDKAEALGAGFDFAPEHTILG